MVVKKVTKKAAAKKASSKKTPAAKAAPARRAGKVFEKRVNLALQGGGAHGAYTWGVLDKFLEDGRVYIEAISGTSAGAMNAVVAADGLVEGGEDGARAALHRFWKAVSEQGKLSPIQRSPIDIWMGNWSLESNPVYVAFDMMTRLFSPYDFNPLGLNPLQDILEQEVDFERVRRCTQMALYISATNVETGVVKVFERNDLTPEMVMASACLPFIFKAVEVDGTPYWDGGYMGNPVLYPFFHRSKSQDILVVQINPVHRPGAPRSAPEILQRVNEITFNSSLLKEFRAINFVDELLEEGRLDPEKYRSIYLHLITSNDELKALGASSKLNSEWAFLKHLFDLGRRAAGDWLDRNYDKLGVESSIKPLDVIQGRTKV